MSDEHVTDAIARRLARASGRRAVLAGLAAGAAEALGTLGSGPEAAARGRARRGCRRDRDCGFGAACRGGRCRGVSGFAKRDARCRTSADCSTASGPAVCERGAVCSITDTVTPPYPVCRGGYSSESGAAATCERGCDCAEGLTCHDGGCRPAAA